MEILILILVVFGALIAIISGIWVAFALGSALSGNGDQKNPSDMTKT